MAAHLHTSTTAVTGAYTASVLTGAVLAVPVGRRLDRHGGRILMTAGSAAGVLLLLAWSQVDALRQLYVVQIGIGAASAASLYEAAFAVVIAATSTQRRSGALLARAMFAIAHVTVGHTLEEQAAAGGPADFTRLRAAVDPETYPALAAAGAALTDPAFATHFEFGLTALIDGLRVRRRK